MVAGVISFYVPTGRAGDAARQAIASQQTQQVIQLEADAKTFYQVAYSAYFNRRECVAGIAAACKQADTGLGGSPLISAEYTIGADQANVSDAAVRKDADSLVSYGLLPLLAI